MFCQFNSLFANTETYEAINKLLIYRIIYANFIHEYGINFHELYLCYVRQSTILNRISEQIGAVQSPLQRGFTAGILFYPETGRNEHACMLLIYLLVKLRTTREMITKRIRGQQKQPGSFILHAEPLSR